MIKHALIALALTAGLSAAASAQQDNISVAADANTRSASINIADLNLARAADRSALHSRVQHAARAVCTFDKSLTVDTACAYDAHSDGARQASAAIAAAAGGRVAANSIVLHAAR